MNLMVNRVQARAIGIVSLEMNFTPRLCKHMPIDLAVSFGPGDGPNSLGVRWHLFRVGHCASLMDRGVK